VFQLWAESAFQTGLGHNYEHQRRLLLAVSSTLVTMCTTYLASMNCCPFCPHFAERTQLDSTPHYTNKKKKKERLPLADPSTSRTSGRYKQCVHHYNFIICTQTGSGVHPTSYTTGTGSSFPGVKRPGREADRSPPANAEVKKMWIYTTTPLYAFMA
jgi:hypothetical protein